MISVEPPTLSALDHLDLFQLPHSHVVRHSPGDLVSLLVVSLQAQLVDRSWVLYLVVHRGQHPILRLLVLSELHRFISLVLLFLGLFLSGLV